MRGIEFRVIACALDSLQMVDHFLQHCERERESERERERAREGERDVSCVSTACERHIGFCDWHILVVACERHMYLSDSSGKGMKGGRE